MMSSESVKRFPDCPHRNGFACSWISERIGRLYGVNPLICNHVCKSAGPYCGQPATNEESFLAAMWRRSSPLGDANLARRVVVNYSRPVDIHIPKLWPEIKKAITFLDGKAGYAGAMLTGSVILRIDTAPKDLDIVLRFDTAANALLALQGLPQKIAGIKTDFFYYIGENPDVYFACLDCESKKLYLSGWLPLTINSIEDGIETILAPESRFGEMVRSLLAQSPELLKAASTGWQGVMREWDSLTKFVAAARSRGILATAKHIAGLDKTDGFHVDQETYKLRRNSCFGDESKPACPMLVTNAKGHRFCGACRCGETQIARLDADTAEDYTKLHHPVLHCPIKREGFTR